LMRRDKVVVYVIVALAVAGLFSAVPFAQSYTGQKIAETMSSPLPSAPEPVLQGSDFPVQVKDLSDALAGGDASAWSGEIGSMYGRYTLSLVNGTFDGEKWLLYFNVPGDVHPGLYDLTLTQSDGGASEGIIQSRCVWVLDEWPESLVISHLTDIHEPITATCCPVTTTTRGTAAPSTPFTVGSSTIRSSWGTSCSSPWTAEAWAPSLRSN